MNNILAPQLSRTFLAIALIVCISNSFLLAMRRPIDPCSKIIKNTKQRTINPIEKLNRELCANIYGILEQREKTLKLPSNTFSLTPYQIGQFEIRLGNFFRYTEKQSILRELEYDELYEKITGYTNEVFKKYYENPDQLDPIKYEHVYKIVENLSNLAGIATPELRFFRSTLPNLWVNQRTANSFIVITQGALDSFDEYELTAFLAHELGHLFAQDYKNSVEAHTRIKQNAAPGFEIKNCQEWINLHKEAEYAADKFAAQLLQSSESLIAGLEKIKPLYNPQDPYHPSPDERIEKLKTI